MVSIRQRQRLTQYGVAKISQRCLLFFKKRVFFTRMISHNYDQVFQVFWKDSARLKSRTIVYRKIVKGRKHYVKLNVFILPQ